MFYCGKSKNPDQAPYTAIKDIELGNTNTAPGKYQSASIPPPICFVFKSSDSTGGKKVKAKPKKDDQTKKTRDAKKAGTRYFSLILPIEENHFFFF